MAIHNQLDILKKGVRAWNEWRVKHTTVLTDPDLRGAGFNISRMDPDLSCADLANMNLIDMDLGGANLTSANLHGAPRPWGTLALV